MPIEHDLLAQKCEFDRPRIDGSRWCRIHNAFQERNRRARCSRAADHDALSRDLGGVA